MPKFIIAGDEVTSLGSIDSKEDVKTWPGFNLNPPPRDLRCQCCGRHIDELKPFGKAGDPLVGDFDGALLVKTFRPAAPPLEEIDRIYREFFGNCCTDEETEKAMEKFIKKFGEKEAESIIDHYHASWSVGVSWECRDCIVLEPDGCYFETRSRGYFKS